MNLASRLLVNGFNREYEWTVVVSNDADSPGRCGRFGTISAFVSPWSTQTLGTPAPETGRRCDLREGPLDASWKT